MMNKKEKRARMDVLKNVSHNSFCQFTMLLQELDTDEMREMIQHIAKESRELLCEVYCVHLENIQEETEHQFEIHLLDGFEMMAADIIHWRD